MERSNLSYKPSIYNYCLEKQGSVVIYNTLYNTLVRLNEEEYKQYLGETEAESDNRDSFVELGLWVKQEVDEFRNYVSYSNAHNSYMKDPLSVTITTTLKCNARCSYCYEAGVKQVDMNSDLEDKLFEFIKGKEDSKGVLINWFGGEPLLNMELMDSLCDRLSKENIKFGSYIITNGSKITDEIIEEKFSKWNVYSMQITLDGTEEQYEKRKNYYDKQEGDFYRILSIIKKAARKKITINLRLNIDLDNSEDILELLPQIDKIFAGNKNVLFYPAFITGGTRAVDEEKRVEIVRRMFEKVSDIQRFSVARRLHSYPRTHACMNEHPGSFTIDVNGNIYSCEHNVGRSDKSIGDVLEGLIKEDKRGAKTSFNEECRRCIFLPRCFGGCESNYINGDIPCMIEKYMIKAYLETI